MLPRYLSLSPDLMRFLVAACVTGLACYADSKLLITSDLRFFSFIKSVIAARSYVRRNLCLSEILEENACQWPMKEFIQSADQPSRALSFKDSSAYVRRIASWGYHTAGLRAGDRVALLMENRVEYVLIWLGLSKIGVVTALLNTDWDHRNVIDAIEISKARALIVGEECLQTIAPELAAAIPCVYTMRDSEAESFHTIPSVLRCVSIDASIEGAPDLAVPHRANISDVAVLVFRNGALKSSKAIHVTHVQIILRALCFQNCMHLGPLDRMYVALPLYHNSAGTLGAGMAIVSGATLCIARKFSVSKYWPQVRQCRCTIVQYIGEMCRKLIETPRHARDGENHVRAAFGNGLHRAIWAEFQARFRIPTVYEFYLSTESSMDLLNMCRTMEDQGHFGKRGFFINFFSGTRLVKYDIENDKHARDPRTNALQLCQANQIGELLISMHHKDTAFQNHAHDYKASSAGILSNVFLQGDRYYRTGDLFTFDEKHCWHFVDRIGDTFRYKGEIVSATEIADILKEFVGFDDVCVYGIRLPNHTSRACMAAVRGKMLFDTDAFTRFVRNKVPEYAIPMFVRPVNAMEMTEPYESWTEKMREEGLDIALLCDSEKCVWYFDRTARSYKRLSVEKYHSQVLQARL